MPKDSLTIVRAELSLDEIRTALRISQEDARVTSWFAEIWGEQLFKYKKHINSNHAGLDGATNLGAMGRFDVSVRCFNKGTIKFQKSKNIGSGRSATQEDLILAIEDVVCVVVVDLREFPVLQFFPLDCKPLLRRVRQGKFTTTGISPSRFDSWIAESFTTETVDIDLQPGPLVQIRSPT